jgi:hypothetical protein
MKLSRRLFMKKSGALVGVAGISSAFVGVAAIYARGATKMSTCSTQIAATGDVVMFFDGQLWLDSSGMGAQYRAPAGMRAAEPLACLADDELQCLYGRI